MTYRTIAVILQGEQESSRVLDCAVSLATRTGAHLVGVHAEVLPVPYTSAVGFPDTDFIQVSTELNKETTLKLRGIFHERAEDSGVSFEWRTLESFSGDGSISGLSSIRSADLVIAAQRNVESEDGTDVESLVYDSCRPILMVPQSGAVLSFYRRVLLAWNGSKEAARATFDALPFLIDAEQTDILVIDPSHTAEEGPEAAGSRIADTLSRHGVNVSVSIQESGSQSVEALIQERLAATGADLLVLGAYSHSWLRELLFGGVTRSILRTSPVTVLISR